MKRFLALLIVVLVFSVVLSACGSKQTGSTPNEAEVTETTVVLETTEDGGSVEQDADGNKITKDKDGKVTAVEDKDGNPIDVATYLETHSWVENAGSGNSSALSDSDSSNPGQSSDPQDSVTEGDIPVVIATFPDDDNVIEIPDI